MRKRERGWIVGLQDSGLFYVLSYSIHFVRGVDHSGGCDIVDLAKSDTQPAWPGARSESTCCNSRKILRWGLLLNAYAETRVEFHTLVPMIGDVNSVA